MSVEEKVGSTSTSWFYRGVVFALVALAVVMMFDKIPQLADVPADLPRRFEATWLNMIYTAYASLLALFVVWKVGHKSEGQILGVVLALAAVLYSAAVTPQGEAGPVGRWLITVTVALVMPLALYFWVVYPQRMMLLDVKALDAGRGKRTWFGWFNRATSYAVEKTLESHLVKAAYIAAILIFAHQIARPGSYSYSLFLRTVPVAEEPLLNGFGFPAVLLAMAFTWTAFRVADAVQKRRVLWILFSGIVTVLWNTLAVTLGALAGIFDTAWIDAVAPIVSNSYQPFTAGISLTGFALGMFYSGALDLRPLISKTTGYTAIFIVLTVLFAGIEEIVESQIVERLNVADGVGTWIGAGMVALTFGPLQARVDKIVKKVGETIEPHEEAVAETA